MTDNCLQPSQMCLLLLIWALVCWLCGKFLSLERIDGQSWNKVYQTEVMERSCRYLTWRCVFDGRLTTALQIMPLVYDMGTGLLIMLYITKSWHWWKLMKQSLAYRGDGEELIDTKLGGVHSTDSRLQPSHLCLLLLICALACWLISKSGTDPLTHLEQSFTDRGDEEGLIETKPGGVHSTDSRLQPSEICP